MDLVACVLGAQSRLLVCDLTIWVTHSVQLQTHPLSMSFLSGQSHNARTDRSVWGVNGIHYESIKRRETVLEISLLPHSVLEYGSEFVLIYMVSAVRII